MQNADYSQKINLIKKNSFFIIGAPKCGTTSLAFHLSEHPEIAFSNPKEPHYFSPDYPFGPPNLVQIDDYLACFNLSNNTKALGEGSVFYLYSQVAVPKIEELTTQQPKYIVCLRNPVDASFSLHAQHVAFGWEPERDYLTALQRREEVSSTSSQELKIAKILDYSRIYSYSTYLKQLLSSVNRERIFFYILERDGQDLAKFYDCLHDFIGVSRRTVKVEQRVNEARRINRDWMYRILTDPKALTVARWLRKIIAPQGFGLGRPIRHISKQERKIAQNIFAEDINETSAIVNFNSVNWEV